MSIRDYIRAEAERSPSGIDVNVLASNVIRSIPPAEMPTILHELVVNAIRHESVNTTAQGRMTISNRKAPQQGRPKWDVLAPYRAMLNRSQAIDGGIYRLGDLTADQLRRAADHRRTMARTVLANADWYEKIAAACDEHGADKVDDLPDAVLEQLHQERAA